MSRQIGGASAPVAGFKDSYELKQILKEERSTALLRHRDTKCDCWNEKSENSDPYCSLCGGTGWNFIERRVRIIFVMGDIQRTRDSGYMFTHAGIVEGGDANAVIDPQHNKIIHMEDFILFPYGTRETPQEYIIQTVQPAYGTKGKIMFLFLKLSKAPKSAIRY